MGGIQPLIAIASNSFLESIRDKILYAFLVFALLLTLGGTLLGTLSVGQDLQIIVDFGLAIISIIGGIIAIFVGTSLVYKELDRRTIYLIVTKPISRWQFVSGKYLGLSAALLVVTAAMGLFLCLTVFILSGDRSIVLKLVESLALIYAEFLFINAIATFFSTFATPLMSVIFTLAAWLIAHAGQSLQALGKLSNNQLVAYLFNGIYWVAPDLAKLTQVRSDLMYGVQPSFPLMVFLLTYLLAYIILLLVLATFITEHKEFA